MSRTRYPIADRGESERILAEIKKRHEAAARDAEETLKKLLAAINRETKSEEALRIESLAPTLVPISDESETEKLKLILPREPNSSDKEKPTPTNPGKEDASSNDRSHEDNSLNVKAP